MSTSKIKVLFIDDEIGNVTSFKASFRRDYDVYTANSGAEGLEVLAKEEIHVIFTDQRMPEMTGIQFFSSIIDKYPKPIRVLITGYSDIASVIDAINKGNVYKYINKPWNETEIRYVIESAYKMYTKREDQEFFLFKASHDIKSPIYSVKNLIGFVKKEINNPYKINEYIGLVDDSLKYLEDTVNELIEFKTIGEKSLRIEVIDFNGILHQIMSSLSVTANYEKNDIKINIAENLSFYSDSTLLKSIIQNIVHNAIKYGRYSETNPTIDIVIKKVDADKISITVKDNGIGIPLENQSGIFKMFYRGNTISQGTGLGLYIVKTAMDRLDGEICLDSILNKGTTFELIIPNKIDQITLA